MPVELFEASLNVFQVTFKPSGSRKSFILEHDREPNFQDLVKFVDIRARVASSMYGRDYANAKKTKQQDKPSESKQKREKQPKPTISTLLTTSTAHKDTPAAKPSENKHYQSASVSPSIPASDRPVCANCETPGHTIERCFKFKALSLDDKLQVISKLYLCFCCLKPGHGSPHPTS